jgi:hypothetical protein
MLDGQYDLGRRTAGSYSSKMEVTRGTETRTAVSFSKEKSQLASGGVGVEDVAFVKRPVIFGCVATVVATVRCDARQIRERMLLVYQEREVTNRMLVAYDSIFTDRLGHAGVQGVRVQRIAAPQTELQVD